MSILGRLFPGLTLARQAVTVPTPSTALPGLGTPWAGADAPTLTRVVLADVLPTATSLPVDRAAAMSIPSVVKARALILEQLAHRPLRLLTATGDAPAPEWFHSTGVLGASTWHRMADTLDDFIFYGASVWATHRERPDVAAPILAAQRMPRELWRISDARQLEIAAGDGWRTAYSHEVVYLPGPQDGLLTIAEGTLRGAIDIERTWRGRARTPAPMMIVREADPLQPLMEDEITEYMTAFKAARADPDGSIVFVPSQITLELAGETQTDLLTSGRNSAKLDVAAFLNLPSAALDATLEKASLTYETADGKRSELTDRLDYWTGPLEARLSMDDVTPPGTRIRFDMHSPEPATGLPTED